MKVIKLAVCLVALASSGCSGAFSGTIVRGMMRDVNLAREMCEKHIQNELLAQKECFPILNNRELAIRVTKVKNSDGLVVEGHFADGPENHVSCRVQEALATKIRQNPMQLQVGAVYQVQGIPGRIARTAATGMGDDDHFAYTLNECVIQRWTGEGDAAAAVPF